MNRRRNGRSRLRETMGLSLLAACFSSSPALLMASSRSAPIPEIYAAEANGTPVAWTPEMAALGKRLFFEPRLSRDGKVSCATCHDPSRAFTDGVPRFIGRSRNTPPVTRKTRVVKNTIPHPFDPGRHTI